MNMKEKATMSRFLNLAGLSTAAFFNHFGPSVAEENFGARIETTCSNSTVTVRAYVELPKGQSGRYELVAKKSGLTGTSITRQSGLVRQIERGAQSKPLTVSRLSLQNTEKLTAVLEVRTSGGFVHRDEIEISGDQ